jgi:hypothetical protein
VISRSQLHPSLPQSAPPKLGGKFETEPRDHWFAGDGGGVTDLDYYRKAAKPARDVLPRSAIELVSLQGSAFDDFALLGYVPEGTTPAARWTAVTRVFTTPRDEVVALKEWDFGLDDGAVVLIDEMLNTKVGNARATVIVTHEGSFTQTLLTWITGSRKFELIAGCRLRSGCRSPDTWRQIAGTVPVAPFSSVMQMPPR